MNIGGIDIGTSGVKCAVYNEKGACVGFSRKAYSYAENIQGYCLDPNQVWESTKHVLREAAQQCEGEIDGIAVSSIGEACVLVDNRDRVLAPSILYNDKRGMDESEKFIARFGQEAIYARCGIASNGTYSAEKLRWISDHEMYLEKVDKIFLFEDFMIYCLTGQRRISYSLASRTMAFDITKKKWIQEYLDFAGFYTGKMSEPVNSGTESGILKKSLSEELGIKRKMKVFTGGHDHLCCTLGAGMISGDVGVNISGSGDTVSFLLRSPFSDKAMCAGGYSCSPYAGENLYTTYGLCAMSGTLIRWYQKLFGMNQKNFYAEMEKELLNEKTNLIVLPGFTTMGTPDFRLDSTGVIDGLTLKTTGQEIYLGILEGIALHLKMNLELLKYHKIESKKMHVVGGGSKSNIWNQIKADIWRKEVIQVENGEAGTAGCAMLAGIGMGIFKNFEEAALVFVKPRTIYFPNQRRQGEYQEKYQRFLELYTKKKEGMEEKNAGK